MGIAATGFAAYNHSISTVRYHPSKFSIFERSQTIYPIIDLAHVGTVDNFFDFTPAR